LARSGLSAGLYPSDPLTACQADQLLDFVTSQLVPGAGMEGACAALDAYLSHRTLFAGHVLSITDIATWGILQSIPQWNKLRKRYPHLNRWFEYVSTIATLQEVVNAHTSETRDGTKDKVARIAGGGGTAGVDKKKDVGGSWDIDLPGAEMGKVVTRFPPEPSGYLHIGHAKAALLNQEISDRFKGRMLVRFDDTNPSKERDEYVENIINDIKRLGLRFEQITYTSDYFPQLVECAERLINAGHCYCDDTPVDEMREQRMHGIESVCRNRSVEENLRLWQEMLKGSEEGIRNCLRVKLDMTAANKALRDPVAFRCNPTHHWRTGTKYKCYPTYDFACPMVDSLEGVTHALRTSEYRDREAQFQAILGLQQSVWSGLPSVHIWDYARLSFINTVLSKRKLTWFVENGVVDGWNDPRMPTVQVSCKRKAIY
jgi:glutamyl-tRNA synthetase